MEQLPNTGSEDNLDNTSPEVVVDDFNAEDDPDNANPEVAADDISRTKKILFGIGGVAIGVGRTVYRGLYMTKEQRFAQYERERLEEQVQDGTLTPYEADRLSREYARETLRRD